VQRHADVPFAGDPAMKAGLRSMAAEPSVDGWVEQVGRALTSFIHSDPGMPKKLTRELIDHRHNIEQARTLATQAMRPAYNNLKRDRVAQAALLWDHAVAADDLAQARREGYDSILKLGDDGKVVRIPLADWEKGTQKLSAAVDADPEVAAASVMRKDMLKSVFADMVDEGAIIPERELRDYTPMRHITGIARGLAQASGDETLVRRLSQAQRRGTAGGARETNLAALEHDVLTKYFQWKQNRALFNKLMADPAINLTDQFKWGDAIPKNLVRYEPGPGQIGYMPRKPADSALAGALDGMGVDKYASGGFVIPKAVKRAFEEISPKDSMAEDVWRKSGKAAARWLTVYNPANTTLNLASDLVTALTGLPGEKARPLGILKWYGVSAAKRLAKHVTGDKSPMTLRINGQLVDVDQLVEDAGLGQHTTMSQVVGADMSTPAEFANLFPAGETKTGQNPVGQFMRDVRSEVELYPRIAAGLEALERTGDPSEFGRVGRRATLEYGSGAPLAAREPMWRLLTPFIQFQGLAMRHVYESATTKGSRARTLATLVGIPLGFAMWNNQNDEFRKVEDSLPAWERGAAHIILSNPTTGAPLRDRTGKPVVLRVRQFITEEMAKQAGLGNLPSRAARVAQGLDTPMQFMKETAKTAAGNMGSMLTMPSLALDMLSDTDRFGKHKSIGEKVARAVPAVRIAGEAIEGAQHSPAEGAKRLVEEAGGMGFASVSRRGPGLLDAGLQERKRVLRDAKFEMKKAGQNEDKVAMDAAKKKIVAAANELKRYVRAMRATGRLESEAQLDEEAE